jgi:hypothetical protein
MMLDEGGGQEFFCILSSSIDKPVAGYLREGVGSFFVNRQEGCEVFVASHMICL